MKKKILIVDDDQVLLRALTDTFTRAGYFVNQATDGKEALESALAGRPDLILLDIYMPGMDGLTMMKKLRAEGPWGKHVPIILLTNLSADDERIYDSIAKSEPVFYLVKANWNISDVVEKVNETLTK